MRKSKHSEHAIIKSIKQSESGIPAKDICRELGISTALFYQWRSKYSGMEASNLRRLKRKLPRQVKLLGQVDS